MRRITEYFDRCPDTLTIEDLRRYFSQLIGQVSWSTIKIDRCGLQFFYKHTLNKQWEWIGIIKPPKVKRLPNIISPEQVAQIINATREPRYRVLFLTVYTMGLRINEALNLTISDIESHNMQVHIRYGKGGKHSLTERFMPYADTGVPTDIPNCYSQAKVSVAMSLLTIKEPKKRLNRLYRNVVFISELPLTHSDIALQPTS